MLLRFNNQVLSHGPDAVLPQNLNDEWLNILQNMAEDFLNSSYDLEECKKPEDIADPILSVCVSEILRSHPNDIIDISIEEMLERVTIYSLSLIMEAVDRESDIGLEKPTLNNILSWDRIVKLKKVNPEFIKTLEQACILDPDKSFFQKIIEKFL